MTVTVNAMEIRTFMCTTAPQDAAFAADGGAIVSQEWVPAGGA